jgi:hypothetical protein
MSDDLTMYSQQLRWLVDEYYRQQITVDEYRAQRKIIFDNIEMESTGGNSNGESLKADSPDASSPHRE